MASSATEPNPDAANGVQPSSGGSQVAFDDKGAQFTELEDSYTPEEEREVLRRIDWTILPMVCLKLTQPFTCGYDNNTSY